LKVSSRVHGRTTKPAGNKNIRCPGAFDRFGTLSNHPCLRDLSITALKDGSVLGEVCVLKWEIDLVPTITTVVELNVQLTIRNKRTTTFWKPFNSLIRCVHILASVSTLLASERYIVPVHPPTRLRRQTWLCSTQGGIKAVHSRTNS
jgi:hypothetical protein